MELVTYLIDVLATDPKVILLLVGLLFVSVAGILIHIPAKQSKAKLFDGGLTKDSNPEYKRQYISK